MTRIIVPAAVMAAIFSLTACTETPQTAATRKPDTKVWEVSNNAFAAPGWKSGDKVSWEEQMRSRAQAQDEYAKAK
jgi:uncharacterized membrane protein (UPF0127 family)